MLVNATDDFLKLEAERRHRKEAQRTAEDRLLDPWERYRAVTDQCDRLMDLTELYDRKTRFALVILGTLNALNVLLVSRGELVSAVAHGYVMMAAYIAAYGLLSVALLCCAIGALRPSVTTTIGAQTPDDYCDTWRQVQVGALNRQIAAAAYEIGRLNAAKQQALDRVFAGLKILAIMTAVMIVGVALAGSLTVSPGA
jgi:hypothetical protein